MFRWYSGNRGGRGHILVPELFFKKTLLEVVHPNTFPVWVGYNLKSMNEHVTRIPTRFVVNKQHTVLRTPWYHTQQSTTSNNVRVALVYTQCNLLPEGYVCTTGLTQPTHESTVLNLSRRRQNWRSSRWQSIVNFQVIA